MVLVIRIHLFVLPIDLGLGSLAWRPGVRGRTILFMAGWGGGLRWRTAVLVAGLVLLTASVAMLLAVWRLKDLGTAANISQIVGVALAVPALMAGLVAWWWRGRRPRAAMPGQVRSAADVLARLVAAQWEEEPAACSAGLDRGRPRLPCRWSGCCWPHARKGSRSRCLYRPRAGTR